MAKHTLSADRNKTWTINTSDDTWIVNAGVTITVKRHTAITEDKSSRHDNLIKILGTLDVNTSNGVYLQGKNDTVYIGSKGLIDISAFGDGVAFGSSAWGATLENHGKINSDGDGVDFFTNSSSSSKHFSDTVINDGKIVAHNMAISTTADAIDITNTADGLIKGATGILVFGTLTLDNKGTIIGTSDDGHAIYGSIAGDTVINTGMIKGDVFLNAGNDTFTNKGGTVTGEIIGDFGNDTYIVDNASLKLVESDQTGIDTVKSSVSWTLTDYFENLVLTGKGVINATGNDAANALTGNAKANIITGLGGDDTMAGNGGADVFVFSNGSGNDTISDFVGGTDKIDLTTYEGIATLEDIVDVVDGEGGAVITLAEGDTILLTGVSAESVDGTYFTFA